MFNLAFENVQTGIRRYSGRRHPKILEVEKVFNRTECGRIL